MKTARQIRKRIEDLEWSLGMARHAQAGYFPHPGHAEEEKRLVKQIKELKTKLKDLQSWDGK